MADPLRINKTDSVVTVTMPRSKVHKAFNEALIAGQSSLLPPTGNRFAAEFALKIGLAHGSVDADELDDSVNRVTQALPAAGPTAQAASKRLVSRIGGRDIAIDEYTAEAIAALRTSEEGREGVGAFLDKRKPEWQRDN